ncbi:OmpA/MotB family protein [Arthrobacter cryoconiti]|uniref:Flagellar motor protein MotB n=1 Tax=Arthrobacter cryoconiti TaxID=748907 RepID=A0ABV8QYE2_9MICC|nr:flagellar motor protein MotB [Arthrobacter cryoconiti]MCC9067348.1 flagellar motor protein MotB [Arthrobacter cryoconiti]
MSASGGKGRKGRKRRGGSGDHHPDERWMASYMDMVTVLMCLFIVLYAMSSVDSEKFSQLKNSLATGFGQVDVGKIDTASGVVVRPEDVGTEGTFTNDKMAKALAEADKLGALRDSMAASLAAAGLSNNVEFVIDQRGLTVKLVGSQTFFLPDSPALSMTADKVLAAISPQLASAGLEISVEGHAANAITSYPSVWELSADRAVGVLRNLVERGGIPGTSIGAMGYGSSRQVNDDSTEELRELNRRVDIVVLSNQAEDVRALIPEALKSKGNIP